MIAKEDTNQDKYKNIFQIMLEADIKLQALKKNVIALVGNTKAGKSTCSNWICARPMIGSGQIQAICDYVNMVQDASSIGNKSKASETLIPNILSIDANKSLIDMAGYDDSRNYIGVLGVSHMLKSVFQKAQNIKFIIVVNEFDLITPQGQKNCQPFLNFIDMFDFTGISSQAKTSILQSTSLIVSIATYSLEKTINIIKNILEKIRTQKFNFQKKEQIIQLLEHLIQTEKIQVFSKAKIGVPSPECNLITDFENTNSWKYFSFNELKKKEKIQIVKLPFAKLYGKLKEEEKVQFKREIQQRTQFYIKCQLLFGQMFKIPQQKTKEKGEQQEKQNWYRKTINYEKSRKYMQTQILGNSTTNCYKDCQYEITELYKQTYTGLKFEEKNQPPSGIQLIKLLEEIWYETVDLQLKSYEEDYPNFLTKMQNHMKKNLKKIKKIYCANKTDEEKFNYFAFLFLRGFQQFRMLYQIDKQTIAAAPHHISDSIKAYFDNQINDIKANFILNMNDEYLKSPQLTKTALKQLVQQSQIIVQDKVSKYIKKYILKIKQIKILQTFANILLKEEKFDKALVVFMKLQKKIFQKLQQQQCLSQDEQNQNSILVHQNQIVFDQQGRIRYLNNQKIINYGKIANCLQKLDRQRKAFIIYKEIKYVPSAIRCFQMFIKKSPAEQKVQYMMNFSEYCNEVGQINKTLQILQQAYEICRKPQERQSIKQRVRNINKDPIKQFSKAINSEINSMNDLMEDIRDLIQDQEWD